jgi:hypothetical protein
MRTLLVLTAVTACMREPAGHSDTPQPTDTPSHQAAPLPKEAAVNPLDALLLGSLAEPMSVWVVPGTARCTGRATRDVSTRER